MLMRSGQSVWKIVLGLALICLVVFSLSFAVGHQIGFASGRTEGYNIGYPEGYDNGHQTGYSEGNAVGYENGYGKGYENGYGEGYENGYATGENHGYENGYYMGYLDGYNAGYNSGYDNGYDIGYENGLDSVLGHGYSFRDPTYTEMKDFIARDTTDENLYTENYTCINFTADVIRNAKAENIRCAFVYLEFSEAAHAIVAFNTIDRGLIYIEPQNDEEVSVSVGSFYDNNWSWGRITKIVIIW
jgi:hypothetical protein